jgi:hypothetical protein
MKMNKGKKEDKLIEKRAKNKIVEKKIKDEN